jgi:hypothetical protein
MPTDIGRLKVVLEKESDANKLVKLLDGLANEEITVKVLKQTGIGKTVGSSRLRKHSDERVANSASNLLKAWKNLVKSGGSTPSVSATPSEAPPVAPTPATTPVAPAPVIAFDDDEDDDDDFKDKDESTVAAGVETITPFMKGKLGVKKGTLMWFGKWAGSRKAYKDGDVNKFQFTGPSGLPKHKDGAWLAPKNGSYDGFFKYGFGGGAEKIHEKDVALVFTSEKQKGAYTVSATGRNEYGSFILTGSYNAKTQIIMVRGAFGVVQVEYVMSNHILRPPPCSVTRSMYYRKPDLPQMRVR